MEACGSAVHSLVESLRAWADTGALAMQRTSPLCTLHRTLRQSAERQLRMHAVTYCIHHLLFSRPSPHITILSELGADKPWKEISNAPESMESMYISFASLGRISPRFAERLADAGALTALMRLDAKQREHCGQAAGCGPGTSDDAALPDEAAVVCVAVYARSVPRVSHRG